MKSLNKVQIIGRLGQDPDVKSLERGLRVVTGSIATDESYTTKEGVKVDKTEWHRFTAFNQLADVVGKYCKKGHLLFIEGNLKTRSFTNKDGQTQYVTEIIVQQLIMLTSKPKDYQEAGAAESFESSEATATPPPQILPEDSPLF